MPTSLAPATGPEGPIKVARARRRALIAIALLALLCVVWSGIWYFAAGRTEDSIAEAISREEQNGRSFTCGSRRIFGFPFRMEVRCEDAKLAMASQGGQVTMTLPRLTGVAQVYDPTHIILIADGPLSVAAPGKPAMELSWKTLLASIMPASNGFAQRDLVVEAPVLNLRDGQTMTTSSADRLELHARRDPARAPADDAVEIAASLSHLSSPLADAIAGSADKLDAELDLSVSQANAALQHGPEGSPPPGERWRLAGGTVHIVKAGIVKGKLKAAVDGDMGIDEVHRATGRLDTSLEGADALLPRLGIPSAALGLLRLGGGSLRLPITLTNGKVAVGPIVVARLVPLY